MFPKKLINYLRQDTRGLMNMLCNELKSHKYIVTKGFTYVYATPTSDHVPVLLVAHIDTFFDKAPINIFTDTKNTAIWSPEGIGGDDRCGVYCIMELIKKFKCAVLFTDLEERGGGGARDFIHHFPKNPNYKMALQFDRKNGIDSVYYDNDQYLFEDYINGFGFVTSTGSFSDISVIAPAWEINAVNLSVGYYNEHTKHEYINYTLTESTIERVSNMLSKPIPLFEYEEAVYKYYPAKTVSETKYGLVICDYCGKKTSLSYQVKNFNLCYTCKQDYTRQCDYCAENTLDFDLKAVEQGGVLYHVCSECAECVEDLDDGYEQETVSYTGVCHNCRHSCVGDLYANNIIKSKLGTLIKQITVCDACYYDETSYCSECNKLFLDSCLSVVSVLGVTKMVCHSCISVANKATTKPLRSVV